jgi:DNA-binding XRE family transcriptional regulator
VQLGDYLKLSKHTICKIRANEVNLGHKQRFKILDKLGYLAAVSLITSIAPKHLAETIAERAEDRTAIIALANIQDGESPEADMQLLALIKKFTNSETDEDLAEKIGLKRASLSMVRNGKAKFGLYPRLKILKLLDLNADLERFERALESSEELLIIVNEMLGCARNI